MSVSVHAAGVSPSAAAGRAWSVNTTVTSSSWLWKAEAFQVFSTTAVTVSESRLERVPPS